MAAVPTWTGESSFSPGQTPFGFYDSDLDFQVDADKVADYVAKRLGYPMMDVELDSGSMYHAFEDAITHYGNEVFLYKVRENYLSLEGAPTGSNLNNAIINPTLDRVIQISKNYGTEAGVGGNVTKYSGSLAVSTDRQVYDLNVWAADEGIEGGIEVRRVFYEAPPAIMRYFDPFAGTGTGVQSLMDAFDFGSYSPGINFLLMPISYDMIKLQAIEFNDQIRRSAFSFEIVNNKLRIFPVPNRDGTIWFEYFKLSEKSAGAISAPSGAISNIAEVPYSNPVYSSINSIGRSWIYRYAVALAKEKLAYIRGKYETLPVPGSETTLNQADLLEDSRREREDLLEQLRDTLETTSRSAQLERKSKENQFLQDTLMGIPMKIYVG